MLYPETVIQLSEHPNIIGIKEGSPDLGRIGKLTSTFPAGFDILMRASPKFHDSLCLGVKGVIVAIANAAQRFSLQIYDCYQSGDVQGSHERTRSLLGGKVRLPKTVTKARLIQCARPERGLWRPRVAPE
jgi:4-hydroxy-tetrahydrodipicolinate synthase